MRHLFSLLALSVALGHAETTVRGVAPGESSRFPSDGSIFKCLDGSGGDMDASRVNDDYCDCEDGSDEPGTSACSAVSRTFYCVNKGHRGKSIFASRVNDGICDCCDGSDEFASRAGCTNTCAEAAAEFAQRNAALLRTFEAGARARAERVATAASIYAKLQEQVSEAEARLPDAEARVEALKAEVEDVRLAAEKELASRVALLRVELASKLRVTQLNTAQMQQLIIELVLETDGVTPLRNVERATDVFLGPAPKAVEVSAEGEVAEEGAGEAGEAGEAEASTDTAGDADAGAAGEGGEAESSEVGRLIARIKRESAADNDEAVKEKQAEVAAAEEEVVRVKGDAADAAAALALDFGPDQAFLPLKGECISANFGQYKYEVCPFGKAKQDYTSLGSFEGWDEGHSAMRFTGGQRCWNGPERSALVRVHCGSEDRLTRVDEPSTCTYELDLETPSACDSAGAARMGL